MPKKSAGILLYRFKNDTLEMLIVHPGGPFWAKKDEGAWSIPKGEFEDSENILHAAIREFEEETGHQMTGNFVALSPVKLGNNKILYAFALEGNLDITGLRSNTFTMEWPPKTGKMQAFPEIDRAEWVNFESCKLKLNKAQIVLVEELMNLIALKS